MSSMGVHRGELDGDVEENDRLLSGDGLQAS